MGERNLRFDDSYREHIELEDGLEVVLRLIQPTDAQELARGFARMSPRSRFFRFMGGRSKLSEAELKYLCEVDGYDHFAMGAVVRSGAGEDAGAEERGVAVARFVRLRDEPAVAEPAITVVDEYQGKGLGHILLKRLIRAGREREVYRFRCEFLGSNQGTQGLLADFVDSATISRGAGSVVMEFPLPEPSVGELLSDVLRESEMYEAFTEIARGVLPVRIGGDDQ